MGDVGLGDVLEADEDSRSAFVIHSVSLEVESRQREARAGTGPRSEDDSAALRLSLL